MYYELRELTPKHMADFPYYEEAFIWEGAVREGKVLAMCGYEILDKMMFIRYFDVIEEERNQGIGTDLMQTVCLHARRQLAGNAITTCAVAAENREGFERFIFRNGFCVPNYRERAYRVRIDELRNTYLGKLSERSGDFSAQMKPYLELPNSYREKFREQFGAEVLGESIPELSYAIVGANGIRSCVLFSNISGVLTVSAAYTEPSCVVPFINMLAHILKKVVEYESGEYLQMVVINSAGEGLARKLFAGARVSIELMTTIVKTL